jgi:hypothetical protein
MMKAPRWTLVPLAAVCAVYALTDVSICLSCRLDK